MPKMSTPVKMILALVGLVVMVTLAAIGTILLSGSREGDANPAADPSQPTASVGPATSAATAPQVRLSRSRPAAPAVSTATNEPTEGDQAPAADADQSSPEGPAAESQAGLARQRQSLEELAADTETKAAGRTAAHFNIGPDGQSTITVNGKTVTMDSALPLSHYHVRQLELTPQQQSTVDAVDAQFRSLVQRQQQDSQQRLEALLADMRAARENGDQSLLAAAQKELTQYVSDRSQASLDLDKKYLEAVKPALTAEQIQKLDKTGASGGAAIGVYSFSSSDGGKSGHVGAVKVMTFTPDTNSAAGSTPAEAPAK